MFTVPSHSRTCSSACPSHSDRAFPPYRAAPCCPSCFVLPASGYLGPCVELLFPVSAHGSGSKLSLLEIGGDFPGFAQLNSWFSFIFRSHRQIISADLESPREQHIRNWTIMWFLMFLCVPLWTTQSSQYFRAYCRKISITLEILVCHFWCPPLWFHLFNKLAWSFGIIWKWHFRINLIGQNHLGFTLGCLLIWIVSGPVCFSLALLVHMK